MRDIQRERLSHLLANAIVELWKKETGSQCSVIIEGTICITAGTGKTTVLQVADRFSGTIHNSDDKSVQERPASWYTPCVYRYNGLTIDGLGLLSPPGYPEPPRIDTQKAAAMAAFLDKLSPASLASPVTEYSRSSQESQSPSVPPPQEHPMDVSQNGSIHEGASHTESPPPSHGGHHSGSHRDPSNMGRPPSMPAGYYTCTLPKSPDPPQDRWPKHYRYAGEAEERSYERTASPVAVCNSATEKAAVEALAESPLTTHTSRDQLPKRLEFGGSDIASTARQGQPLETRTESYTVGLRRDADLALSSPHNYTAQVREVIRQRLLQSQSSLEEPAGSQTSDHHMNGSMPKRAKYESHLNDRIERRHRSESLPSEGLRQYSDVLPNPKSLLYQSMERAMATSHRADSTPPDWSRHRSESLPSEVLRERADSDSLPGKWECSPEEQFARPHSAASDGVFQEADDSSVDVQRQRSESLPMEGYGPTVEFSPPGRLRSNTSPECPVDSGSGVVECVASRSPPGPASSQPLPQPTTLTTSGLSNFSVATLVSSLAKPRRMAGPVPSFLAHPALPLMNTALPPHPGLKIDTPPFRLEPRTRYYSEGSAHIAPTTSSVTRTVYPHSAPPMLGIKKLDENTESTNETRVYRCEFCSKTFLFKSKYHEHLPVHTNARPYQCHLCSRTYKYKYDLRVHLRTHMGIPTKSTICPFCNFKYESNKQLRLHIRDHHSDKQRVTEEECTQPQDNLPPAL